MRCVRDELGAIRTLNIRELGSGETEELEFLAAWPLKSRDCFSDLMNSRLSLAFSPSLSVIVVTVTNDFQPM
jgi:hypothetical protein